MLSVVLAHSPFADRARFQHFPEGIWESYSSPSSVPAAVQDLVMKAVKQYPDALAPGLQLWAVAVAVALAVGLACSGFSRPLHSAASNRPGVRSLSQSISSRIQMLGCECGGASSTRWPSKSPGVVCRGGLPPFIERTWFLDVQQVPFQGTRAWWKSFQGVRVL